MNGGVHADGLRLAFSYSRNVHDLRTVERLARGFEEALRALIDHCRSPEAGVPTPSDFPLARLDQKTLDEIVQRAAGRLR